MTEETFVLLADLRGLGAVADLRVRLAARSVAQLCAAGAAVIVAPVAESPLTTNTLADGLTLQGLVEPPAGGGELRPLGDERAPAAGRALVAAPLLPESALPDVAPVLLDSLTLATAPAGRAAIAAGAAAGPGLQQETTAAGRLNAAGRRGLVLGDDIDEAALDLLSWASNGAAWVFLGGELGVAWANRDRGPAAAELVRAGVDRVAGMPASVRVDAPIDVLARGPDGEVRGVAVGEVPEGWEVCDLGPRTGMELASGVRTADAILWRGRMGRWQEPGFALGTRWAGEAQAGHLEGFRVAAGDETVAIAARFSLAHRLSYVSPSGDAFIRLVTRYPRESFGLTELLRLLNG